MNIKKKNSRIRIIPLGGLEEVGKNCTIIEYEDEILIVDFGLKFSNEDSPGIDFIINNTNYLENNKNKIKGILITHGHLDHIGGLPYLLDKIKTTIYASNFTCAMINNLNFNKNTKEKLKFKIIKENQNLKIGKFNIDTVKIHHSIIDCLGFIFKTDNGNIIYTGDYKDDKNSYKEKNTDFKQLSKYKNNLLLLSDSTNAHNKNKTTSDKIIYNNLKKIITDTKERIIIATFSTQITRIRQILDICKEKNKKVIFSGFSISKNIEIGIRMNFFKDFDNVIFDIKKQNKMNKKDLVFVCTGTQGEENSSIYKIANDNHKFLKLEKKDTIVFCSSVIPGNEFKVNKIINQLHKKEVNVITNKDIEIHGSGHGGIDELKKVINTVKPKYFIPIHGENMHLAKHKELAINCGVREENIFVLENGQKIEIENQNIKKKEKIKNKILYIENNRILSSQGIFLNERLALKDKGILIFFIKLDYNGQSEVNIEQKGFGFYNNSTEIIDNIKEYLKNDISNNISNYYNDLEKSKLKIKSNIEQILAKNNYKIPLMSLNIIYS